MVRRLLPPLAIKKRETQQERFRTDFNLCEIPRLYIECTYIKCLYIKCLYIKCLYIKCLYIKCLYIKFCLHRMQGTSKIREWTLPSPISPGSEIHPSGVGIHVNVQVIRSMLNSIFQARCIRCIDVEPYVTVHKIHNMSFANLQTFLLFPSNANAINHLLY